MPVWVAIALKDLRLLGRDRVALFWVLGFPLVFALFFGSVMRAGVERERAPLRVVVVDATRSARADTIASGLARAGLAVERQPLAAAREAVRTGAAVAFVQAAPEPLGPVTLGVDPSRPADGSMLEGLVMRMLAPEFVPMTTRPPEIATQHVARVSGRPASGFEVVFPAMILWGLLGCAASFAVAIASERASGTLLRLRAAPIGHGTLLGGKAGACVAACAADALVLSALGWSLLDVRIADPVKYAAALGASVACFAGLTVALSVLGKSEQAVAGAGWSTLIVLAMFGGAMVPLSLTPEWMQSAGKLSPVRWAIRALEGATWRGDDWPLLSRPLLLLVALGGVCFAGGAAVLSRRQAT